MGPPVLAVFWSLIVASSALFGSNTPGRVSYVEGIAAVAQEEDVDWLQVTVNTPVRQADRYILQSDALMELELEGGNFVRFGPDSDATVEEYGSGGIKLVLASGDLIIRLRSPVPVSVSTETAKITLEERGLYRVSRKGKWVKLVVRRGRANVAGQSRTRDLQSGDVLQMQGPNDPATTVSLIDIRDDFDFWSDRRDAGTVGAQSARFMGSDYTGSYELDRYGTWDYEQDYGWVWWPSVSVGWSPYVSGRWVFYPSFGWTWVSYEPWGWLPYHHGRWIYSGLSSSWCWLPGHFNTWSPALVDFHYANGYLCWSPIPYGQDGPSRVRFLDRLRSGNHPGLTVVPENQFVSSSRVRSERNRPVGEVPLPGSDNRRVRAESLGRTPVIDSVPGNAGFGQPSRTGDRTGSRIGTMDRAGTGPRVITIPDSSAAASGSGVYPDRSRIDRAPRDGRGPRRGAPPSAAFGQRIGGRPSYNTGWFRPPAASGAPGVPGTWSPGRSSEPRSGPSWSPSRGAPANTSPQMQMPSGGPSRQEGPSRGFDRPGVGVPRPSTTAPSRSAPPSSSPGPSRSAPASRQR